MKSDFAVDERVRRSDVDGSGSINFAAYARFAELAEHETLRSLGFDDAAFRRLGVRLLHVHIEFDFFKPVGIDDVLTMRTRIAGVGAHSARFKIEVWRASDTAQTAAFTVVATCVDVQNRSVAMPAELGAALRAGLAPG
jgi:4-hydroxybenzoyl-CoA thioesterase